jgi:hypothetical protein
MMPTRKDKPEKGIAPISSAPDVSNRLLVAAATTAHLPALGRYAAQATHRDADVVHVLHQYI